MTDSGALGRVWSRIAKDCLAREIIIVGQPQPSLVMRMLSWAVRHWPSRYAKGRILHSYIIPYSRLPANGEFDASLGDGVRVRLRYSDSIGRTVAATGSYEPGELAFLRSIIRSGETVMDVGANIGVFALVMAKAVGSSGRVIAIEPHPENLGRLRANMRLSEATNIDIVEAAVGAKPDTGVLESASDHALAHMTIKTVADGQTAADTVVAILTLDEVWHRHGNPVVTCIKLDIEGCEVPALHGASELLKTHRPVLLVEANDRPSMQRLDEVLRPYGYKRSEPRSFAKYNYIYAVR